MKINQKAAFLFLATGLVFCMALFLAIIFEKNIYKWWISQTIPNPYIFNIEKSRRTILRIYPNEDNISWFSIKWGPDGSYLDILDSRGIFYAKSFMTIDPNLPAYGQIQFTENNDFTKKTYKLPFGFEESEYLIAGCPKNNLYFTVKYLDNYSDDISTEFRVRKGGNIAKKFLPTNFVFSLYGSPTNDYIESTIENSNFSADCRYLLIDSYTEMWILDTVNLSLQQFTVHQYQSLTDKLFSIVNTYCENCVYPVWSPQGHTFMFQSSSGVERYDIDSQNRSWVVKPSIDVAIRKWSYTGNWISGYYKESVSILSPDGRKIGILDGCESIEQPTWNKTTIETLNEEISWSPTEDKFAYICTQYDRSTCNDGKCGKEETFLVIWDLTEFK